MNKLVEFVRITRPINCLIAFISVWAGAIVAGDIFFSVRIILASASAFFIAAYGNIVNDIFDIEVDRLNKPRRPLVRGVIGRREAGVFSIILCLLGLSISFGIGGWAPLIAGAVIILLLIYTPLVKGTPFLGNLAVAIAASLAFVYGGIAANRPFGALILLIFAFLIHFGREIVKDIEDRAADAKAGFNTIATIGDARIARFSAIAILVILVLATFIPVAIGVYGMGYFIVVLLGVDLLLIKAVRQLAETKSEASMHRIAVWLKIAMPFGLLAVFLGHLGL